MGCFHQTQTPHLWSLCFYPRLSFPECFSTWVWGKSAWLDSGCKDLGIVSLVSCNSVVLRKFREHRAGTSVRESTESTGLQACLLPIFESDTARQDGQRCDDVDSWFLQGLDMLTRRAAESPG